MFKKLLLSLVAFTGMAMGQAVQTPTLQGTYIWTGHDTFTFGNLGFTATPAPCGTSLVMNGFGADFTPNCVQNSSVTSGWFKGTATTQGPTDTTLVMTSLTGVASSGYFFIDGEYEHYTGVNTGTNTLTGVTRAQFLTTAATHTSGTTAFSVDLPFQATNKAPWGGIFSGVTAAFNNGFPISGFPVVVNSGGNEFDVHPDGTISQAGGATNYLSPIQVGVPGGHNDGTNFRIPITDTNQIIQDNAAHEMTSPLGLAAGIAGPVTSIPPANLGAATITPVFIGGGTCSITYVVTGVDADGVEIPGTPVTVSGLASPFTFPGFMSIRYPSSAGLVNYNGYRTGLTGCTGLALGKFVTGTTGNAGSITDIGTGGDASTPPASNNAVAKSCVGSAANHQLYCHLTGSTGTPPVACGSSAYGWDYTNAAASSSATLHCYAGSTTWVATDNGGGSGNIASINGDTTAAQVIQGGGVVSCSTTAGVTTCTAAGGGLTGAVNTGALDQDTFYAAAGTTVSPITHKYTVPTGITAALVSSLFSGVSNSTLTIQNGDTNHFPFVNTTNWVIDSRMDIPTIGWSVKQSGAQCDMRQDTATVSSGSATLTITGGSYSLQASDAGDATTHLGNKSIEIVGLVGGVPTVFDASIIAVASGSSATLSANSPFSLTNYAVTIGHDDTTAFNSAISLWQGAPMEITLPAKGTCWTSTIPLQGQSMGGVGRSATNWSGKAGRDTLAANDPTNGGYVGNSIGQHLHDMTIGFDARIDATKPWNLDNNGTTTAQTPMYRPWGILTYLANNPLGWGWIQGSQNGVASVTNGNAVMCVPTGITRPPIGQTIFFPYQAAGTANFVATVSSYAGSCGSGTPVTLSTTYTPPTASQAEWFTGTSIQKVSTSISSATLINTGSPLTITLANPINPTPLNTPYPGSDTGDSNVAPFGTVIIDAEQFTYFVTSAYPASTSGTSTITLTGRAQNGTTAANHSGSPIIAPLNPYQPTWPWPVFNTSGASINGATSTPATAEYFPGPSAGNAALSFPVYDGSHWAGSESLSQAVVENVAFQQYPLLVLSGESGNGFQLQNSTTCMYIVALPFKSHFSNLDCTNAQMGIIEGAPSINQASYFSNGFPTADSNVWSSIGVQSAAFPLDFVGGGSNTYENFQLFSQNGGTIGMSNYPANGAYSGAGSGWMWSGTYSDNFSPVVGGSSGSKYLTAKNFYIELETGVTNGKIPAFRLGCLTVCDWTLNQNAGGIGFITGSNNHLNGGAYPNQGPSLPYINLGTNTELDQVAGFGAQLISNTYGLCLYCAWGFGGHASGNVAAGAEGGIGPRGNVQVGSQAPVIGQTAHALEVGNDDNPEVSADSAEIFPYEFGVSSGFDAAPFKAVIHDDGAPLSASYVSCPVTTTGGCITFQFNQGGRIAIGPSQRLAFEQYVVHYAFKTPAGANSFSFNLAGINSGAGCSGAGNLLSKTITTTSSSWVKGRALVDFSTLSGSGCLFQIGTVNSSFNTEVDTAYVILTPVWNGPVLPTLTPTVGSPCPDGTVNGTLLGIDAGFLYVCSANVVKAAVIN